MRKNKIFEGVDSKGCVSGYIYNQNSDYIKKYRFGVVNSKNLGCWWIATYNVAQMLELDLNSETVYDSNGNHDPMRNPEDIIRMYEESTGLLLHGIYAIHPFAIADFFAKRS